MPKIKPNPTKTGKWTLKYFKDPEHANHYQGQYGKIKGKEKHSTPSISSNKAKRYLTPHAYYHLPKYIQFKKTPTANQLQSAIAKFLEHIPFVNETTARSKFLYGKLTATDILEKRKIPVRIQKGEALWGCAMLTDVVGGILRHTPGITHVRHVRTITNFGRPHSIISFTLEQLINGKKVKINYVADPFLFGQMVFGGSKEKPRIIVQVGEKYGQIINALKEAGLWKEGHTLSDFSPNYTAYESETRTAIQKIRSNPHLREVIGEMQKMTK